MSDDPLFWAKVRRGDGCWEWQGSRHEKGYGVLGRDNRHWRAHRYAYTITFGPIPDGMVVRHVVCDNPPCVRPDHLALGSAQQNTQDAKAKGRLATGDRVAHKGNSNGAHRLRERCLRGERHPQAKLSRQQVLAIRAARQAGQTLGQIATQFGVSKTTIGDIALRRIWRDV